MLIAHPIPGKLKSEAICAAFIEGAPQSVAGHVFYGVNESNLTVYRKAKAKANASGEPVYVIDNSAFDCVRGVQFRVSLNRYHHNGLGVSDGARFKALGIEVKPWVVPGPDRPFTLFVQQSESFMRCVAEDPRWLEVAMNLRRTDTALIRAWNRNKALAGTTLAADIARSRLVVTHSSAAAVEALLAGVPVLVSPLSPCYSIMSRQQELRQGLFNVLADNQWTLDEMRNGTAWKALNQ